MRYILPFLKILNRVVNDKLLIIIVLTNLNA